MVDKQAAALIFENIAMLEDAIRLIDGELSRQVFDAIDEVIRHRVEALGWNGQLAFWDDETFFGPEQWRGCSADEGDWTAWYEIDGDDPDDEYWLTLLLAARQGRIGFRFNIDYADCLDLGKREWKSLALSWNRRHPQLEAAGFRYEPADGTWFLPWSIDARRLAEGYANDAIEDALDPLKEALDRIESVHPHFSQIVEAAKEKLARSDDT